MRRTAFRQAGVPADVTFVVTYECAFACGYCDIWRLREREMATEAAMDMVSELAALGVRSIRFCGGDPLTRPDIGETLALCAGLGISTTVATGGPLVEERLPELAAATRLLVRLDWQDRHPDERADYERSLRAISAARDAGVDAAGSVVLTRSNAGALPAILSDAASLGVELVFRRLERYGFSADNSRLASMMPSADELMGATGLLMEHRRRGGRVAVEGAREAFRQDGRPTQGEFVISPSGLVSAVYGMLGSRRLPSGVDMGFRAAYERALELWPFSRAVAGLSRPEPSGAHAGGGPRHEAQSLAGENHT